MTRDILIFDDQAEGYPESLATHGIPSTDLQIASHPDQVVDLDCQVWLARPDFAAAILDAGAKPPRWIQSTWAGVAPLVSICRNRGILLTTVRGIFGPQISEYVFAYLLRVTQKQAEFELMSRAHHWHRQAIDSLQGKTLLILGTGSIGSHIATTGRYFGMRVTGLNNGSRAESVFHKVVQTDGLMKAIAGADFVVSTLPDTPSTQGLLNGTMLGQMKPSAHLVNVGRASVLDHNTLQEMLNNGRLAGARLDVLPQEPLPKEDSLWDTPGLEITPHIAAMSYPSDVARVFGANLVRFRQGKILEHLVDLSRGY